jgi:hypothetical protein
MDTYMCTHTDTHPNARDTHTHTHTRTQTHTHISIRQQTPAVYQTHVSNTLATH